MISEGPNLIEALSGELQAALDAALEPDETPVIAVRGSVREAFAATRTRLLVLKEPVVRGMTPVEVRSVPLSTLRSVRTEPRPTGGRLSWESTDPSAPTSIEYPAYDSGKYERVAAKLRDMFERKSNPSVPGTAPLENAGRACPKCRSPIPAEGCWCPACGLQVSDPCWECGRALATGDVVCAYCGTPNTEPALVACPECGGSVARGKGYCSACGTQSRLVCAECDRPLRKDWKFCPECGGEAAWPDAGVEPEVAHLGDEPDDPSAWLRSGPLARDAQELNASGVEAFERQDFREAARLFRLAAEADPGNASYFTNLGVACGELGDDLQAFSAYRRAVELNPRELSAYLNMGYLYMERERASEAREMWEKVVRLAPDSAEADEARQNLQKADEI